MALYDAAFQSTMLQNILEQSWAAATRLRGRRGTSLGLSNQELLWTIPKVSSKESMRISWDGY